MREFEKWWKKGNLYDFPDFEPNEDSFVKGCRQGWRAALEWVLSRVEYANSDGSIIQDIKQELKE